ncbi:protein kinase-like domain, Concanavalin A-like lectin/glucanase domain protein [Artemisia annua]|uniref:non-specific serine/threonine protein kinase n=1 Tax=Artemisia annua TaxID=35608 RepID=A0A2U1KA05_ARTAN|nr:protein kinase-like domain, Concanavalin A-like lectin/glucanase domain protein [Artemisia annua]
MELSKQSKLSPFIPLSVVQAIEDMENEKPIRFTAQHLRIATNNFSIGLGSGGYGTVYKGISRSNVPIAVKVLKGASDKIIEEQFIAEVSTMGRTHHYNLVRLYGFCFESSSNLLDVMSDVAAAISIVVIIFLVILGASIVCYLCEKDNQMELSKQSKLSPFIPLSVVQAIEDMENEKPIRFTAQHLRIATNNFSIGLGSGGYGTVYKGISRSNVPIAVKVLKGASDKIIEEQFIAEVSTMGRTHHYNLVRLYGFCFESSLIALVYEYMVNGSLDNHLFKSNKGAIIGFEKLHAIAIGTANGISYLHEQCPQRIVHYDIKPGNILLDSSFSAKVSDFGLAKLCSRDSSHITMTRERGTPGYAAPELWMPFPVTHKCDVYSFGMLLFEIIGQRSSGGREDLSTQCEPRKKCP